MNLPMFFIVYLLVKPADLAYNDGVDETNHMEGK